MKIGCGFFYVFMMFMHISLKFNPLVPMHTLHAHTHAQTHTHTHVAADKRNNSFTSSSDDDFRYPPSLHMQLCGWSRKIKIGG